MVINNFAVARILDKQEGSNLKGDWKYVDCALRKDEEVTLSNGTKSKVTDLIAIRVRGEKVDKFLSEVRAGMVIDAVVHPSCEERTSQKSGKDYICNDMVFSCPEWKVNVSL